MGAQLITAFFSSLTTANAQLRGVYPPQVQVCAPALFDFAVSVCCLRIFEPWTTRSVFVDNHKALAHASFTRF